MTKRAKKKGGKGQVAITDLKAKKDVKGGKTPSPGGPVPIPYPN